MQPGLAASMMPLNWRPRLFRRCIQHRQDDMPLRVDFAPTSQRTKPLAHARGTQGTLPSGSIGYFIQRMMGRRARAFG